MNVRGHYASAHTICIPGLYVTKVPALKRQQTPLQAKVVIGQLYNRGDWRQIVEPCIFIYTKKKKPEFLKRVKKALRNTLWSVCGLLIVSTIVGVLSL